MSQNLQFINSSCPWKYYWDDLDVYSNLVVRNIILSFSFVVKIPAFSTFFNFPKLLIITKVEKLFSMCPLVKLSLAEALNLYCLNNLMNIGDCNLIPNTTDRSNYDVLTFLEYKCSLVLNSNRLGSLPNFTFNINSFMTEAVIT